MERARSALEDSLDRVASLVRAMEARARTGLTAMALASRVPAHALEALAKECVQIALLATLELWAQANVSDAHAGFTAPLAVLRATATTERAWTDRLAVVHA
eukprot:Opistho-2@34000